MSEHFFKHAVLASYLEPRMSDAEWIDALKFHFPIYVQNAFAAARLISIQDAIDLLKTLEVVESRENQRKLNSTTSAQNSPKHGRPYLNNQGSHSNGKSSDYRSRPHNLNVRQVYFQHRPHHQSRRNYREGNGRSPSSTEQRNANRGEREPMNHNVPDFPKNNRNQDRWVH
jgi:hypothetical protein